jgi:hypothetical protein
MISLELRNLDEARRFLLQGLWLQRALPPSVGRVRAALEWALEVASAGQPLPPIGFVADLGHLAFDPDAVLQTRTRTVPDVLTLPGMPGELLRTYEDHVLGKVLTDWTFLRASDWLRHYKDRDRARGLAFLLNQFRERAGFAGVELSPAVIKGVLEGGPSEALAQGWEALAQDGLSSLLVELYESLVTATRRTAEVLAPEDVDALADRTALQELGERLALQQVRQAAYRLEASLPHHRLRPRAGRREVPTHVLDEDTYPVGGFSSLSTRGSVESLLHSQLAYMEKAERPDLFDIKCLRDELLYYARDENQFLRRRRTFVFVLLPDLVQTRFKDVELPWQRGVLLLGLLAAAVRKLCEWLSTDALTFLFAFLSEGKTDPLAAERDLLRAVLREQIANGTVEMAELTSLPQVAQECARRTRRSLCHCLVVSTTGQGFEAEDIVVTRLRVDSAVPAVAQGEHPLARPESDEPLESWNALLRHLLEGWL